MLNYHKRPFPLIQLLISYPFIPTSKTTQAKTKHHITQIEKLFLLCQLQQCLT